MKRAMRPLWTEQVQLEQLFVIEQVDSPIVIHIKSMDAFPTWGSIFGICLVAAETALQPGEVRQVAIRVVVHIQKRATVLARRIAALVRRAVVGDALIPWRFLITRARAPQATPANALTDAGTSWRVRAIVETARLAITVNVVVVDAFERADGARPDFLWISRPEKPEPQAGPSEGRQVRVIPEIIDCAKAQGIGVWVCCITLCGPVYASFRDFSRPIGQVVNLSAVVVDVVEDHVFQCETGQETKIK